ncbi:MAG: hypothetical protein DSZ12_03255 [Sulfurovum sp.]|nr:MAG: hypothetical protein DSZ12_03255 [Sulfurovum sp.]
MTLNALESETYYKLVHLADSLSKEIINAQMKGSNLHLPKSEGFSYKLIFFKQCLWKYVISNETTIIKTSIIK